MSDRQPKRARTDTATAASQQQQQQDLAPSNPPSIATTSTSQLATSESSESSSTTTTTTTATNPTATNPTATNPTATGHLSTSSTYNPFSPWVRIEESLQGAFRDGACVLITLHFASSYPSPSPPVPHSVVSYGRLLNSSDVWVLNKLQEMEFISGSIETGWSLTENSSTLFDFLVSTTTTTTTTTTTSSSSSSSSSLSSPSSPLSTTSSVEKVLRELVPSVHSSLLSSAARDFQDGLLTYLLNHPTELFLTLTEHWQWVARTGLALRLTSTEEEEAHHAFANHFMTSEWQRCAGLNVAGPLAQHVCAHGYPSIRDECVLIARQWIFLPHHPVLHPLLASFLDPVADSGKRLLLDSSRNLPREVPRLDDLASTALKLMAGSLVITEGDLQATVTLDDGTLVLLSSRAVSIAPSVNSPAKVAHPELCVEMPFEVDHWRRWGQGMVLAVGKNLPRTITLVNPKHGILTTLDISPAPPFTFFMDNGTKIFLANLVRGKRDSPGISVRMRLYQLTNASSPHLPICDQSVEWSSQSLPLPAFRTIGPTVQGHLTRDPLTLHFAAPGTFPPFTNPMPDCTPPADHLETTRPLAVGTGESPENELPTDVLRSLYWTVISYEQPSLVWLKGPDQSLYLMTVDGVRAWLDQLPVATQAVEKAATWESRAAGKPFATQLLVACELDYTEAVEELLLDHAAEITSNVDWGADGWTPLHYTAQFGSLEAAQALLTAHAPKDWIVSMTSANSTGHTPFYLACQKGHLPFAKLMLRHSDPSVLDAPERHGWTPLNAACDKGHLDVVRFLLDQAHSRALDQANNALNTPLHVCAARNHTELLLYLLNVAKADPTGRNSKNETALHVACLRHPDSTEVIAALKAVTPDAESIVLSTAPFANARHGQRDALEAWIRAGGSPNTKYVNGCPLLSFALGQRNFDVLVLLLAEGADPNATDSHGRSAFHLAFTSSPNPARAFELLSTDSRFPSSMAVQDETGATPLWYAAQVGALESASLILEHDPSCVDIPNNLGQTPLWVAAKNSHLAAVELLLDADAFPGTTSSDGSTPLSVASHPAIESMLRT